MSETSKKARRDEAREHARELREKERKRRARNSLLIKVLVGVVIAAVAVGTVFVVTAIRQAEIEAATPKPGPANMLSDGIILTGDGSNQIVAEPTAAIAAGEEPVATDPDDYAGVVRIVTYIDYLCPFCKSFEMTNLEQIGTWVSAGAATLEVHPIAILDNASMGSRYSSRAANAMACVANFSPDDFFQASAALYNNQPAEATTGLTDDEIIGVLSTVRVTDPDIADCIKDETFRQWVTAATERTAAGPIPNSDLPFVASTPTILVNGIQYTGSITDAAEFNNFVTAIATGDYEDTE